MIQVMPQTLEDLRDVLVRETSEKVVARLELSYMGDDDHAHAVAHGMLTVDDVGFYCRVDKGPIIGLYWTADLHELIEQLGGVHV